MTNDRADFWSRTFTAIEKPFLYLGQLIRTAVLDCQVLGTDSYAFDLRLSLFIPIKRGFPVRHHVPWLNLLFFNSDCNPVTKRFIFYLFWAPNLPTEVALIPLIVQNKSIFWTYVIYYTHLDRNYNYEKNLGSFRHKLK